MIKRGKTPGDELSAAEGAQEKERKLLPKETEEYAYQKGLLHRALKRLNRVGFAAFAGDRAHKGKYGFEVLYRKSHAPSRAKAEKAAAGTTA